MSLITQIFYKLNELYNGLIILEILIATDDACVSENSKRQIIGGRDGYRTFSLNPYYK